MTAKGAVAAGHPETARAAAEVLAGGGNAFDAALAALVAACVAESALASLGGGGFMLARPAGAEPRLYDFFAQTPKVRRPRAEIDFFPIEADFGTARQEFHTGLGAIATPGVVAGIFRIHRDLGRMPLARLVEPATALARGGVRVNRLQAFIFEMLAAILLSTAGARALYGGGRGPAGLLGEGEEFRLPEFADTLENLVREGPGLFYRGDLARRLADDCAEGGGHLTPADLAGYGVAVRAPLARDLGGFRVFTNPPPSTGGILVAFALEMLRRDGLGRVDHGSLRHLDRLARAMDATNRARLENDVEGTGAALLDPDLVAAYRARVMGRPAATRGTTHISVIDAAGNVAAVTLSNGEGSGYVVPGTGIMLNNMLGEDDINPKGFHRWPRDTRLGSMMAPTLAIRPTGVEVAMGSGGSNRIRTAILQVLLNLFELGLPVDEAVARPRIHLEDGRLSLEPGFAPEVVAALRDRCSEVEPWDEPNMFFGGVHAVSFDPATGRFAGAGDHRRGGTAVIVGG